jgi:hypothetical protein
MVSSAATMPGAHGTTCLATEESGQPMPMSLSISAISPAAPVK